MSEFLIFSLLAVYFFTNLALWRKLRSSRLLFLQVIVYFYNIHGFVVATTYVAGYDGLYSGVVLDYPYFVSWNDNFVLAFAVGILFSLAYTLTLHLIVVRREVSPGTAYFVRVKRVVALGAASLVVGFSFWYEILFAALISGESAYLIYKGGGTLGGFYALVGQLMIFGLVMLLIPNSRFLGRNALADWLGFAYESLGLRIAALAGMVASTLFLVMLGDKVMITTAILFVFLMYEFGVEKVRVRYVLGVLAVATAVNLISLVRHYDAIQEMSLPMILMGSVLHLFEHGEAISSMSLYYVFNNDIPINYGDSFVRAIVNLVPSFLLEQPKIDPFAYLARFMAIGDDIQGWGISYSTDWYVNFGFPGVVVGAVLLAALHGGLYRYGGRSVLGNLVFASVVATLPTYLRNGIAVNQIIYAVILAVAVYSVLSRRESERKGPASSHVGAEAAWRGHHAN
jgi:hypothetical protein